jgi:hypothetical protein
MMYAAYVLDAGRKARVFSLVPLPEPELMALVAATIDDDDAARAEMLGDVMAQGALRATVFPGNMSVPDVLHVCVASLSGIPLFACNVVSEERVSTMLREAPFVVEAFSLQVAQGDTVTDEGLASALSTWVSRNFPGLPAPAIQVERWLAPPQSLPAFWDLDASVADPPLLGAA